MKKKWKRLAVFLALVVIGTGNHVLFALDQKETKDSSENGVSTEAVAADAVTGTEKHQEGLVNERTTENMAASVSEKIEGKARLPEIGGGRAKRQKRALKNTDNRKVQKKNIGTKTNTGQTLLDVSQGDITITLHGAVVTASGGSEILNESELNVKGYRITGTTTQYNVQVEKDVTVDLTLDNVNITCDTTKMDCINVSHANVTMTLEGTNQLICNAGTTGDATGGPTYGAALAKDGMDGQLTIQCDRTEEKGHKCDDNCGSLLAKGNPDLYHAGAISNAMRKINTPSECGFANLTVKGGNIEALAGKHSPGIGSICISEHQGGGYTKNIRITGGNIRAVGTEYGSGIGSGYGNKVDGIYISGGTVNATGGAYAPGIGASKCGNSPVFPNQSMITTNIEISGGDTVVIAVGDSASSMPGIGSGAGNSKVSNVLASPELGYQGYIQDGTTLDHYTFMQGTPFASTTAITLGQFCTKVYFGPYRDVNEIDPDTKDQIGANHVISKTGGEEFTQSQLKKLTKVNGKEEDGTSFNVEELNFKDPKQVEVINKAKKEGKIGEYPLTYCTPNGTEVTVSIFLRDCGTDAAEFDPEHPTPSIGANGFEKETGGNPFTEEELKNYGAVKGKDKDGNTVPLDGFTLDPGQFQQINAAKTAGKTGSFDLTYTADNGSKVTVKISLIHYDEVTEDPENDEIIKAMHIISKTGGEAFTEEQLKELSIVRAFDEHGDEIPREDLVISDPEQARRINEAKVAGEIGDFLLSFQTPNKTEVTVTVFLREKGSDGAKADKETPQSLIAANNISHETKGKAFSEAELIALCKAKGKDASRNNAQVKADETQMSLINKAKTAGKTGSFDLTFSLSDGTKVTVKVSLTGNHNVSFDPNGGDYIPETQILSGGKKAIEPKEPKRDGYTFEGWYYKDETGKEVRWDFGTPVHEDLKLIAKWKRIPSNGGDSEENDGKKTDPKKKKSPDKRWNYHEIENTQNGSKDKTAPRTGDEAEIPGLFGIIGLSGIGTMTLYYRKKKRFK
nr:InlB B-repeat-containing protein [uncultured Anaerostipes sp.]